MTPLAAGPHAHCKGWQMIEDKWEKLLSFSSRTEVMRMKLASLKIALEATECGSRVPKKQRIDHFLKTNIGRMAWKDFKDGSPGKRVAITGKGKDELNQKQKEQEGRERTMRTEFTYDVETCTIKDQNEAVPNKINQKATAFVRDTARITLEDVFEALVRDVNKNKDGVK